ncbi:NADH-quinone oxidoreductase subunit NuoE [Dehalogenimonas sp. THU2]|uniref:NADH-quinone oxidoreductase subunit NuoE n=1 Tax=Dehalogenimonas sp. THU2 TaxID=3151121 RepID=UPI003218BD2C
MIPENLTSKEELQALLCGFSRDQANLIPMLQQLQERLGYLPPEAMAAAAERLGLAESTVYSVASFYTQFRFKPSGRNVIKVCRGTACHVGGGERILSELERQLEIKPGETTADLEYSLDTVACIGACALAPVVLLNEEIHGKTSTGNILDAITRRKKTGTGCSCRQ